MACSSITTSLIRLFDVTQILWQTSVTPAITLRISWSSISNPLVFPPRNIMVYLSTPKVHQQGTKAWKHSEKWLKMYTRNTLTTICTVYGTFTHNCTVLLSCIFTDVWYVLNSTIGTYIVQLFCTHTLSCHEIYLSTKKVAYTEDQNSNENSREWFWSRCKRYISG